MTRFTRRAVLGTLLAAASGAGANTPVSLQPKPRPVAPDLGQLAPRSAALVAGENLGGRVSYLLADARTGQVLDHAQPDWRMPPASTAKTITAAYALDHLGPAHRYCTQVIATGPIRNGRLDGDLILLGGGDPLLTTDHLALMVQRLRESGLQSLSGQFAYWDGALPHIWEIDPAQPDHLRYNTSLSGLNLNFNRVHLGWRLENADHRLSLDARTRSHVPPVSVIRAQTTSRNLPIFTHSYDMGERIERWMVAQSALAGEGARWLPVRQSGNYAADVFRALARGQGLELPAAIALKAPVSGAVLARHDSAPMRDVLRGMLRYSTNVTAEIAGLSASAARGETRPEDLSQSAAMMSDWAREALDLRDSRFADHSGLSGLSRVTARDMVQALRVLGPSGGMADVLREITLKNDAGRTEPLRLRAKTGTLNFVSSLAGFVTTTRGRELAFAILTDEPSRRAKIAPEDRERPAGSKGWTRRSRAMQYDLIRLWAGVT